MTRTKKLELRKLTLADAVSEAYGEFQSLGEELCSWGDNIEEKFSTTEKYDRIREAQEALENLSEPSIPDAPGALEIEVPVFKYGRRGPSRADRCSDACTLLDACITALDEYTEENPDGDKHDEAEELRDELDDAKAEAEGVEFPGMFG